MVWKNHIVAVFTPTTEDTGHWGTGVPISDDLVLTARHVLYPKEGYGDHIRLCWWGSAKRKRIDGDEHRIFQTVGRDKIIELDDKFDVALIRCNAPDDLPGFVDLDKRKPRGEFFWEGIGFAKVAKIGGQRDPANFRGAQDTGPDWQNYVDFPVDNPADSEAKWGGSSGMPIVARDSNKVIAVCKSVPYGFQAGRLRGTPVWQLLKNKKFKELVTPKDPHSERRQQLIEELKNGIDRDATWMTAFAKQLGTKAAKAFQKGNSDFVDVMLGADLTGDQVMQALHTVYDAQHDAQASIAKFATQLVPILTANAALSREKKSCAESEACSGTMTMAEVLASFLDGRVASYYPRISEMDSSPIGKYLVPLAPVAGHGEDVNLVMAKNILEDLKQKIEPFNGENQKALLNYFKKTPVYSSQYASLTTEQELDRVSVNLRDLFRFRKFRFYLAISFYGLKDAQVKQLNKVLKEIRSRIPEILIFELHPDFEIEDRGAVGAFPFMLPIKGENQ